MIEVSQLKSAYIMDLQFFAKDGPGGEKTEEPTSKKLSDARKEGQVCKSKEIAGSLSLFALFLMLKIWTGILSEQFMELFGFYYNLIPDFAIAHQGELSIEFFGALLNEGVKDIIIICLPFFVVSFLVAFISDLVQVKWQPTSKPLQPKFSKMNPISGVKKLFSSQALVELLKSILKIAIMIYIAYGELKENWRYLFMLFDMSITEAVILAGTLLIDIGFKISLLFMVVAAVDYLYQKWKFNEDMKMTKQEVKDEYKSTEGDPQIKGKIRRRMMESSQRRMMQNLPKADVVITNPTHYAVAIMYDKEVADAPVVIAKGVDYLAQKIKEEAREHNVEIVENKPLARSLYANVEIGNPVPPELYVAVAEVLAAVYRAQGKV